MSGPSDRPREAARVSSRIDAVAYANRLRHLSAAGKALFSAALLLLALAADWPVQLAIALWLAVWVVAYAAIPIRLYLGLLLPPLGFVAASLPALLLGVGPAGLELRPDGLALAAPLLMRTLAASSCLLFLLLTTPFADLAQLLSRWGLSPLLLELMVATYRLIFSLEAIVAELHTAQRARGGHDGWWRSLRSFGLLAGQLLQRSLDTYRQSALALQARGGGVGFCALTPRPQPLTWRHGVEAALGCSLLCLLALGRLP